MRWRRRFTIYSPSPILIILLVILGFAYTLPTTDETPPSPSSSHYPPQVALDYATYQGLRDPVSGVDQYLGMRYAAAPLGDLRFRAPVDPVKTHGVQNVIEYQPFCVGVGLQVGNGLAEDCLFVNVFTPSAATPESNLPVWFYIPGGGYAWQSNNNYNGSDIVQSSGHNVVLVNFNYRIGALGFLSSENVIRDGGDLNVGLLDQRQALKWVQKYIKQVNKYTLSFSFFLEGVPGFIE
jgi:acetylcholinesterase